MSTALPDYHDHNGLSGRVCKAGHRFIFSAELVLVSGLFWGCGCNRLPSLMLRIVCLQLCGSGQGLPV